MHLEEALALAVYVFDRHTLRIRLLIMGHAMYIILLLASFFGCVVVARPSIGCQSPVKVDLETTHNVTLSDRRYLLWFPENYHPKEPAPLILSYQYVCSVPIFYTWLEDLLRSFNSGGSRDAENQQALDLLSTPYFNKDYIVVYPNAVDVSRPLSKTFWPPVSCSLGHLHKLRFWLIV